MAKSLAELIDQLLVDKSSLIKLMKLTTPPQAKNNSSNRSVGKQESSDRMSEKSQEEGGNCPAISFSNLLTFQTIKDQFTSFGLDSSTLQ